MKGQTVYWRPVTGYYTHLSALRALLKNKKRSKRCPGYEDEHL